MKHSSVAALRVDGTHTPGVATRVATLDWPRITADLDARGCAIVPAMLAHDACAALVNCYAQEDLFRSRLRSGHRHTLGVIFHDAL